MRVLFALLLVLAAAGAAAQQGPAPPGPLQEHAPPRATVPGDPAQAVVLIFNHGTSRPQRRHQCNEERDVPAVVRDFTFHLTRRNHGAISRYDHSLGSPRPFGRHGRRWSGYAG